MALDPARFRKVHDFAVEEGFVGAFPNFHQAEYDVGVVFGSTLLKPGFAIWRDVPASTLGNPDSPEARISAVYDYAVANGFVGGFPNFHQADYGQGVVYGTILLKPGCAIWQDVSASTLGNSDSSEARFIAVHNYAVANGFIGGFPNFHQADYGQGVVYGCLLIKPEAGEWFDVPSKSYDELVLELEQIYNEIGEGNLASAFNQVPEVSEAFIIQGGKEAIKACARSKGCRTAAKAAYKLIRKKIRHLMKNEKERREERERFERMDRTNYELEKFDRWERTA